MNSLIIEQSLSPQVSIFIDMSDILFDSLNNADGQTSSNMDVYSLGQF